MGIPERLHGHPPGRVSSSENSDVQSVPIHRPGADEQHVRAERSQLFLRFRRSSFPDTDDGNHSTDSNDQAEHRQAGAHFVTSQRA